MKKSWTIAALLAAFAAGTASAAGTVAGTTITNQAEIIYTPEGSTTPAQPVKSNEVTTKVLPVPSFTITPNDEGPAGPTFPTQNNDLKKTLAPCSTAVFLYTLTNTGNVPSESYALTAETAGTPAITDVRYYPVSADTNNDGTLSAAEITASTAITSIANVNQDQAVKFFQVYTVPCDATNGQTLGADPVGTRKPNDASKGYEPAAPFTQPVDNDNYNTVTVDRKDAVVIGPKNDADGNGNPTTPAYDSPEGVKITPTTTDTQVAQATPATTSVTFTNTVQNPGNRADVYDITATTTIPGATVTLLKPDGTPLQDNDGDGIPDVGTLTPGQTADILVKVTFPAGTAPTPGTVPGVTITATSSNDKTKSDPTTDIVNLPGLSFGTPKDGVGAQPEKPGTPAPGQPGESASNPVKLPDVCTAPVNASLPVDVANLGSVADTFDVTGTTEITLKSGGTTTVNVAYYLDKNGNGFYDAGDTALTDTNGNGTPDTGSIAPNSEVKLVAVVAVPCDAAAQTITLKQQAKSPTTGVSGKDDNDTIVIGTSGKPTAVKNVDLDKALPGQEVTYTIVGKNSSNATVTKAMVCDTVPANTTFVSFTATTTATGKVLYSNNGGGTWSVTASAPAAGEKLCAAVDTSGDNTITTADRLTPGQDITVTFKVKVN